MGRLTPWTDPSYGFSDGYAERGEAVQHGHADLELGNLMIEVLCGQTLAEQIDTVHLGFDAASTVIAAPSSPGGLSEAARYAQGFRHVRFSGGGLNF